MQKIKFLEGYSNKYFVVIDAKKKKTQITHLHDYCSAFNVIYDEVYFSKNNFVIFAFCAESKNEIGMQMLQSIPEIVGEITVINLHVDVIGQN